MHRHHWTSPHSIVGGNKENPGVWSLGGHKMVTREVCACGAARREESDTTPGGESSEIVITSAGGRETHWSTWRGGRPVRTATPA